MSELTPNVALVFSREEGIEDYTLAGYLDDDGLILSVHHDYDFAMDLANTAVDLFRKYKSFYEGMKARVGRDITQGYINGGILLNSPYYWTATNPISFSLTLFQIAQKENEIIQSYQDVLRAMSPKQDDGLAKQLTEDAAIAIGTRGPSSVDVHYFPQESTGVGKIQFLGCLCRDITMRIKAPYDKASSPIIGEYTFQLQTPRIVAQNNIDTIFNITNEGGGI
jgi:hypothetical protein